MANPKTPRRPIDYHEAEGLKGAPPHVAPSLAALRRERAWRERMMIGASKSITVTLKPGTYQLFSNVPGHYAAGQHTLVTVTR